MQLPTAGGFPVEPHRRCCGLHGLLSARKRQLTYSFCYAVVVFYSPEVNPYMSVIFALGCLIVVFGPVIKSVVKVSADNLSIVVLFDS